MRSGAAARRGHDEALAPEPGERAIVDDDAILVQHEAVADAAFLERRHVVRVEAVDEARGVRARHLDLSERRGIEYPDARSHGRRFALHGLLRALALARIAGGTHPAARFPPVRAECLVFGMRRQQAPRRIARADLAACQRTERHGCVGRTERRRSDLGGMALSELRDRQERIEIARLALVGGHAAGRVALQVLDVLVTFGERNLRVCDRDVVQEIEPLAAVASVGHDVATHRRPATGAPPARSAAPQAARRACRRVRGRAGSRPSCRRSFDRVSCSRSARRRRGAAAAFAAGGSCGSFRRKRAARACVSRDGPPASSRPTCRAHRRRSPRRNSALRAASGGRRAPSRQTSPDGLRRLGRAATWRGPLALPHGCRQASRPAPLRRRGRARRDKRNRCWWRAR